MKPLMILALLTALAACGVKGDPVRETPSDAPLVSAPEPASTPDIPARQSGWTLF